MGKAHILGSILVVAVVIGGVLGTIFVQLIQFELRSQNSGMARVWVIEWIVFDLLLTAFLCRREIRSLFRKEPPNKAQTSGNASAQRNNFLLEKHTGTGV